MESFKHAMYTLSTIAISRLCCFVKKYHNRDWL